MKGDCAMLTNAQMGQYLKNLREKKGLSLRQVDYRSDWISYSNLSMIEKGTRKPSTFVLRELAKIYEIDIFDLLDKAGYTDRLGIKKTNRTVPVLGRIPAGIPVEWVEDILGYEDISEEMARGGKKYFALKVNGDSMESEYKNGDIIIVLQQETCENGQDCVVMIDGEDGTFKRVFYNDNGITLQPLNNSYMPLFFAGNEAKKVKILGVVKEIRRRV